MSKSYPPNSRGREANAAEPPGKTPGLKSEQGQEKTAERSRKAAGPDGPDASKIAKTFKR